MKRLRHYDKELAVVLSVFGSSESLAMQQYLQLCDEVKEDLGPDIEVRLAISSRTVLKKLETQGNYHYTLAEQLAALDRLGYKKVVVASINLFPTEEHEYLLQIVDAFRKTISKARYEVTVPLFTKAKKTNEYLKLLNDKFHSEYNVSNIVYVAHGAPSLNTSGNQTFAYARSYLKLLNSGNLFYTIEGSFAYDKSFVSQEAGLQGSAKGNSALVVPLLLVTGNHSKSDIKEIKNELNECFDTVKTPENFLSEGDFSLLKVKEIRNYFKEEIQEAIKKVNW